MYISHPSTVQYTVFAFLLLLYLQSSFYKNFAKVYSDGEGKEYIWKGKEKVWQNFGLSRLSRLSSDSSLCPQYQPSVVGTSKCLH